METTGPTTLVSIHGKPTGIFFTSVINVSKYLSCNFLWTKILEGELQDSPLVSKRIPLIVKSTAKLISASSKTIRGFLPPNSSDIFFNKGAASLAIAIPV